MTRKTQYFAGEKHHPADGRIIGIEPRLRRVLFRKAVTVAAPLQRAKRDDHVFRQAKDLGDVAERAAWAIGNDGGCEAGAFAAVFLVNVLDDFLAPLMFEIDVDVGRLAPRRRDETREEKIVLRRIDSGDSQHIANGGIGRRATPLAEDFLLARIGDDFVNGEKIGRVIELFDQRQFLGDEVAHLFRRALRVASRQSAAGQLLQPFLRRPAGRSRLVGIFVSKLAQMEIRLREKARGFGHRIRRVGEKPRHFPQRFEMAFGIDFEPPPRLRQSGLFAHAGQHVLQGAIFRTGVERIVLRQQFHSLRLSEPAQFLQATAIGAAAWHVDAKPDSLRTGGGKTRQRRRESGGFLRRQKDQEKVVSRRQQVVEMQQAITLFRPPFAKGEQAAQTPPPCPIGRIDGDIRRAVAKDCARPGQ